MHEDGRNKGMNSTSSEKGTDGKKNNTSEYNHQYYMKNKDKWRDNKSSVNSKYSEYDENDKDFDESNYNEKNRLGDTDFFGFQKPDGSWVILEEDMKWTLPAGLNKNELIKALEDFDKSIESSRQNGGKWTFEDWQKGATNAINKAASGKSGGEKEFDVDAAARDVIRGKYGNGAERKAALGDDYAEVQKRVNEILGGKTSSESKKTSKNTSKPVDGPKETPHANFPSSNSTSSAPRAREKNVTGTGTGLYRRDKVEDNKPRKREKNVTGTGTGLYTRGKVAHAEGGFNVGYFYRDDELAHHGILGQKWGVRRFEKAGGGLTAAGRARYNTVDGKYQKLKESKAAKKSALSEYNKAFAKAYNASQRLNITKKRKADRDAKIAKAYESGEKADNAVKDYKKAKTDYKFEKKIAKNEAEMDRILEKRAENREKLANKKTLKEKIYDVNAKVYDKLGNKTLASMNKAAANKEHAKNAERMKTKLKDFDEGTSFVKAGYERYSKVLSDYRDMKISSIGDRSVKKSDSYKQAKSAYNNQVASNNLYGKAGTTLNYAREAAREKYKKNR